MFHPITSDFKKEIWKFLAFFFLFSQTWYSGHKEQYTQVNKFKYPSLQTKKCLKKQ